MLLRKSAGGLAGTGAVSVTIAVVTPLFPVWAWIVIAIVLYIACAVLLRPEIKALYGLLRSRVRTPLPKGERERFMDLAVPIENQTSAYSLMGTAYRVLTPTDTYGIDRAELCLELDELGIPYPALGATNWRHYLVELAALARRGRLNQARQLLEESATKTLDKSD